MDNLLIIKAIQSKVGTTADGIIGPKTLAAIADKLGVEVPKQDFTIPTQAEVRSGKSVYGAAGDESNLTNITPPYPLFFEGRQVKTIRVHRMIADRVLDALRDVLGHYGPTKIKALGLDQYSGSYNYRKNTGGSSLSLHSWGIALDFDAEHNTYSMHKPQARFSAPEYDEWWNIWERHGGYSLGRRSDCDYMHVQFARFS